MDEINIEKLKKKQLWEMTKAEYESVYGRPKSRSSVTGKFSAHISAIEIALNRGIKVPDDVLADYPWFKEN